MIFMRIFILSAGLIGLAACSGSPEESTHVGYVEAEWLYIAAPQSGWLVNRPVREGDRVSEGDLLFQLDSDKQLAALAESTGRVAQAGAEARNVETGARPAEIRALEAQLAEAEARLAHAVSERDRILPLVERGIESSNRGVQVSANARMAEAAVRAAKENINVARLAGRPAVKEAAEAGVITAEAQRASAEVALKERTVSSKTSGRIEEVFHHPGEFVIAGRPVLALLPDDGLKIKFFVSQAELPQLAVGKSVHATADGKPDGVDAEISYIAPDAEFTPPVIYSRDSRGKLVFLVEATLPEGSGFHPGLPIDVKWN